MGRWMELDQDHVQCISDVEPSGPALNTCYAVPHNNLFDSYLKTSVFIS
jgi:hypothetical protein